METLRDWKPTELGTPQGAVISPLLANLYLEALDHLVAQAGYQMSRYADDFVIQCRSRAEAEAALELVRQWVTDAGLTLHPTKTRIVDASQAGGFDFLGYHYERGYQWPRAKSLDKLKATLKARTRRVEGRSLQDIIQGLNRVLRGWFRYFYRSVRNIFEDLDGMIRRRLRRIQLKRHKRGGNGLGWAHRAWPNAYFAQPGLYRLTQAHQRRQSQR